MTPGGATVEDVDPFDPISLRVSPNFEAVAVKRVIVTVRSASPSDRSSSASTPTRASGSTPR